MIETKGDILLIKEGIICHQVNCLGIMGAGLAYQIKNKYPNVFIKYKEFCSKYQIYELLGKIQICSVESYLAICNIFGQEFTSLGKNTSYDAVDKALESLKGYYDSSLNIYFPKNMGCCLGGGIWNIYLEIIKTYFPNGIIVEYEKDKIPY
jgi:O-acetyl-ADP-ribose deacetylase (regulator of RNase III)